MQLEEGGRLISVMGLSFGWDRRRFSVVVVRAYNHLMREGVSGWWASRFFFGGGRWVGYEAIGQ